MTTSRRRFGAVRKLPSGRWQVRYWDSHGARRTAPQTFATQTAAKHWLTLAEADMSRGEWHDPRSGEVELASFSDRWMRTTLHLRPSTRSLYGYLLANHIEPTFGPRTVGSITPLDIQAWIAERHAAGFSPNTVAKAYRLLRLICDSAVEAGLIPKNPCRLKGAGTERHPEMRFASPEEVALLADTVEPRWSTLILTAAYSGLRWGELVGLRRRNVDPIRKRLSVVEQVTEVEGVLAVGPPKSEAGRRTISLPDLVVDALGSHMAVYSEAGPLGLVFPAPEGGPMRRSNFRQRVWLPATKATGMTGLRFHDLRHTGSTLAAGNGAPLRALMHRMGQSSAAAALRYQHLVQGQDEEIALYLDALARAADASPRPALSKPVRIVMGTRRARRPRSGSSGGGPRTKKAL